MIRIGPILCDRARRACFGISLGAYDILRSFFIHVYLRSFFPADHLLSVWLHNIPHPRDERYVMFSFCRVAFITADVEIWSRCDGGQLPNNVVDKLVRDLAGCA